MKKFLNILGSTINAALVGILAGQVFEGGMTSIYWWVCIGIVVVGNLLQALRTNKVEIVEVVKENATVEN